MLIKNESSSVLLSYSCTLIREEEPGDTLSKHGAETERRTRRCSVRSVEPASQKEQSVLWEMMSTSGKSLLVIIHYVYLTHSQLKIKVPTVRELHFGCRIMKNKLLKFILLMSRITLQGIFTTCACWHCLSPLQSTSFSSSTR